MNVRTIAGIAGALALAFLLWAAWDRFQLADKVADNKACAAAIATPDGVLDRCEPRLKAAADELRRGRACEAAIGAGDLHAERASCGEHAKRRGAELAAARANALDLANQLRIEREGRQAAIDRAAARAREEATRRTNQNAIINSQPRTPDGRVRCDARCLRELGGAAP